MSQSFLTAELTRYLLGQAKPVAGVPDLVEVGKGGGLETPESLRFLTALFESIHVDLEKLLTRREQDRKFIDDRVRACHEFNRELGRDFLDPDYKTVLGLEDAHGRIVFGPKTPHYNRPGGKPVAPLPEFLKGPHVTLFGPPDSAKMAINAMNAYHRKLPTEPACVEELLSSQAAAPMWGADDEDSKTPLRRDLMDAAVNLTACLDGSLSLEEGGKTYSLATTRLAQPIKRFPGLALPSTFLFYKNKPVPLHLYDFALHLYRNWDNPRALVFYVPKLENEEEARYIHKMIAAAEDMIRREHAEYVLGTVRLMIVLENPRAILRTHEIMDALHPYFAGASLGWHDYLASTARLFREDSNYRIPVKADPDIVIKYIKASHLLLADVVGSRGGIQVGGMYGILPLADHPQSLQVTLRGFIKDVVTQMKRGLTGFWVAHPDFVRLGLALVEAWKRHEASNSEPLADLVKSLLDPEYHREVLDFIRNPDIEGLDVDDPGYVRSLIVADLKESDYIPNHHPDEIRYNVFQSLQYLADWLCGNGCVALPTVVGGVPVRVMDDLATAERSRWEVWHELRHGRFSTEDFIQIVHEEMNFIRRDLSNEKKIVQVKWNERTAKWYPIALKIMLQLMTDPEPVEFATELLLPFTVDSIRNAPDPWKAMQEVDSGRYRLQKAVADYEHYFEICGVRRFAQVMASSAIEDRNVAERTILSFTREEVIQAASFHGDIGQSKKSLDSRAASEQSRALAGEGAILAELSSLGDRYRQKHGFKFLTSAQGKSAEELLSALNQRMDQSADQELENARRALWEISRKRMQESSRGHLDQIEEIRKKYLVPGLSIALNYRHQTQELAFGSATPGTWFQLASLSKTAASAFSLEYFRAKKIPLETSVNVLLAKSGSSFRLKSAEDPAWADRVTLAHLMNHTALGMHYVNGFPRSEALPRCGDLISGNARYGYALVSVISEPGQTFQYSGGGFLVLEHLIEELEKKPIGELTRPFLDGLGLKNLSFTDDGEKCARGYLDSGDEVPGKGLRFPACAAGATGTAGDMARLVLALSDAFTSLDGKSGISHDTAVEMLRGTDRGSREFMGCDMGLGVFVAEAGANRIALHQGANEGFRALFAQCFAGPDRGKGFVILCNGDNRAVGMIAEVARVLFSALQIQGVDFGRLAGEFNSSQIKQEQIVNQSYKALIFDAFEPDLPEEIIERGPLDPLAPFNLAVGARVVSVTNQEFARAENLVSPHIPAFDPELYGRHGKIMDSWETVRHNPRDRDTLVLALSKASAIRYVSFSTMFHDGNHPEFARLLGWDGKKWLEIVPKTELQGHSLLGIDLEETSVPFSQIQVEIFPDGGLSRLGLYRELPKDQAQQFKNRSEAQSVRFPHPIPKPNKPLTIPYLPTSGEIEKNIKRTSALGKQIDLACLAYGGAVIAASNEHYGPAAQVISPYPPIHMFDGMESARSRKPGHFEEVTICLGKPAPIERIILDFTFFVHNNPLDISIAGLRDGKWLEIVPLSRVKSFAGNKKEFMIKGSGPLEQIRVRTHPDGGIHRVKALGPAV